MAIRVIVAGLAASAREGCVIRFERLSQKLAFKS